MERNQSRFGSIARSLLGAAVHTVVEVGARDCRETLGFLQMFPRARIFAFECNPDTLPECRERVAGHAGISLVERAVSDRSGAVSFYPIDAGATPREKYNPGASSLLRASGGYALENYVQRETRVESVTLADFMAAEGIPGIDLLWMDIQGAELAALRGLRERIADVKLMHLEAEFVEIYAGQPLFPEIRRFLRAAGFRFLGFSIYSRHSADAIFANARHFPLARRIAACLAEPIILRKRLTYARHRLAGRLA